MNKYTTQNILTEDMKHLKRKEYRAFEYGHTLYVGNLFGNTFDRRLKMLKCFDPIISF